METLGVAEFAKKDLQKQKEYELVTAPGAGCATCPIFPICKGDAKNQKSKSPMLKPIDDLIKKATENGPDWALAQLMNLKPSVEGIVFKEFDENLHMVSWGQMWRTLTGKDFPGECTHDIFVKKCHEMRLSCYAGVDWGWSAPSTVVYFFVDHKENVYVVRCDGRTHYSNPNWVHHIKTKWHNLYRCQLYFPDLANPGDGEEMRKAGLPVPSHVEKNIDSGVQVIKKWLKSLASPVPKIFFATETCQPLKTEMNLMHYKVDSSGTVTDTIDEGGDHFIDSIRYAMYGLFGKSQAMVAAYGLDIDYMNNNKQPDGSFMKTPTAAEYAAAKGVLINTEIDTSNLGKIGTASELNNDDDENSASGGGFLWSF